jgi:hypothetical protein
MAAHSHDDTSDIPESTCTVVEAASIIACSRQRVDQLVAAGTLHAFVHHVPDGRCRRVLDRAEVERYASERARVGAHAANLARWR